MRLKPPESVRKLQRALHVKAKGSPGQRFHSLYDKVYRADVLAHAYRQCKSNDGTSGVDGQRFEDIESYGVEQWLGGIGTGTQGEDVSSATGSPGVHTQGEREAATVGDSNDSGSRGANGGGIGLGADLRG